MFMTTYEKSILEDFLRVSYDFREYYWFIEKENISILKLHFTFVNMSITWKTVKILLSVSSWDFLEEKRKEKCSNKYF